MRVCCIGDWQGMASTWSLDLVVISIGQLCTILSELEVEASVLRRAVGRATSEGSSVAELLQQHGPVPPLAGLAGPAASAAIAAPVAAGAKAPPANLVRPLVVPPMPLGVSPGGSPADVAVGPKVKAPPPLLPAPAGGG